MHCPWHMNPDKQLQAGLQSISLMPLELRRAHKKYSLCRAISVGITFSITSHSSPETSYQKTLTQEVLLKFPGKTCGAKGATRGGGVWRRSDTHLFVKIAEERCSFNSIFFFFDCKLSSDIRSSSLICSVALVEMMQNTWQEGNRLALVQTQHMKMY